MNFDILCVFGRPIEKVNGHWQLSAYFERITETGAHPGIREEDIDPNSEDPRIVIAGAEVNALACAVLFEKLRNEGAPPKVVIFSAGRPPYLRNDPDPDLNEAQIFREFFLKHARPSPETELVLQTQNINSYGDIVETLRLAQRKGLQSIGLVTLTVHMARCREFFRHALKQEVGFLGMQVGWFASEPLVLEEFSANYAFLWEAMISKAYARTAEHERKGITDLREGRYRLTAPGFQIASTKS